MKFILLQLIALVLMFANPAKATTIDGIRLGDGFVELDVTYSGGCFTHDFSLNKKLCSRSTPSRCGIELVDHTTNDTCRAIVQTTIVLPFETADYSENVHELIFLDSQANQVIVPLTTN